MSNMDDMNEENPYNFTVGELIEILEQHPKDMPVLVSGYDSGYNNFYPAVIKIKHEPENMYQDGEFQWNQSSFSVDGNENKALVLKREFRDD